VAYKVGEILVRAKAVLFYQKSLVETGTMYLAKMIRSRKPTPWL